MATKLITEMLEEINKDVTNVLKYKDNAALKLFMEHAFNPEKKFILPEGDPPYKEDAAPIGMNPANLFMEARKLYVFCRNDLSAVRRETLFIQLLENVHPKEAKFLLAVKDQQVTKMYPTITHKLMYEHGYVSVEPPKVKPKKSKAPAETGATQ